MNFLTGFSSMAGSYELQILPSKFVLDGVEARQSVLAVKVRDHEIHGEVQDIEWSIDPSGIVKIEEGVVYPLSNGTAAITVQSGNQTARAVVEVRDFDKEWQWSFRNHVLPVLSKAGCNSGACHGTLAGKGGFRLSLRGYDPETDYHRITREARGRRIELGEPARSLFLAKPTTAIRHKGGHRFDSESEDYRILSEWISHGAPASNPEESRLDHIEILPSRSMLRKGDSQRLLVRAFYTDGRQEDVTPWVKFTSVDETIAQVDESGRVTVIGYGESAVTAWFSSRIVIARLTSPFPNELDADGFDEIERRNFIDDLVLNQLQRLNLKSSPRSLDGEFLRRSFLSTLGVLPTLEQSRAFLKDKSPDKRDRVIDELLAQPEFVDYWTYKWSDMLLINGRKLRPEAVRIYYQWVRDQVRRSVPWDEFARKIVTARGSSLENGATNFYAVHQDPETMAENVSQAFLGLSINCAKCHNHPLEKWTNDQYYGFANLFSRVRAKGWGGDSRNGDGGRTLYVLPQGELIQPRTGKPQPPAPLDGVPLSFDATEDRREYLADWLTSPENPYFSRAIANRVWANFLGVGLVESIDDLRISNPASNEELLTALANYLVEQDYDLKSLMRVILQSETFQRSSRALPENRDEHRYYSRYYPQRLMAEVLHDAIVQVTDVSSDFTQIAFSGGDRQKTDFYPRGTRALQLFDSAVASYFLKTFGRNERAITCECERSNEPSLVQVLHITNGDTINEKLSNEKSRAGALSTAELSDGERITQAYLHALSRFPSAKEKQQMGGLLAEVEGNHKREAIEDLFWGLLSSREFLFNH
ncbi:MAG TPA: DUF1553 domain-containing protein [Verrucomicrobiales bacterium]|nr:DUF1553 domain-containing protein [Verrucomicrobiales bacterium]